MTTMVSDFTPTRHDLVLYRGDAVRMGYRLGSIVPDSDPPELDDPYDLTSVAIAAQVRAKQDDVEPMAEFEIEKGVQSGGTLGYFEIVLPSSIAQDLLATTGTKTWWWDLQVTWGPDDDQTIEYGTVTVSKDSTRAA